MEDWEGGYGACCIFYSIYTQASTDGIAQKCC